MRINICFMVETKDIQYFLKAEKEFRNEHPVMGRFTLMRNMEYVKLVIMMRQVF